MLAAGCQQRRVLPEELRAVLDVLPRAPRRRLIGQAVSDIAGGAQALSEIDSCGCAADTAYPPRPPGTSG
ncbi:hypothetical protein [Micromonospora sp. NPDC047527]|uniref:hypothetical protein n=1 Tax=Micromonospora sp. NPDC047527 TaxID=3155144 RepID=UPI00340874D0